MHTIHYTINGRDVTAHFSHSAMRAVDETCADVAADLRALESGEHTAETLLTHCLGGADLDREQGWHDYVDALVMALEAE